MDMRNVNNIRHIIKDQAKYECVNLHINNKGNIICGIVNQKGVRLRYNEFMHKVEIYVGDFRCYASFEQLSMEERNNNSLFIDIEVRPKKMQKHRMLAEDPVYV
jgi:hypothetical protein